MKQVLDLNALESQTAFELPEREMPLVTVVITNLLNNLTIDVDVSNVNVAAQVCAALLATGAFACSVQQ